ncbi:MAG: SAM-dependent methyltransferase [Bacteroidetes bacterium]|nr:SAM-dependent methyltransferase [Bacteroidota bacterium]
MSKGRLYLIPNLLGITSTHNLPNYQKEIIERIQHYIFENEKPGRAFIKKVCPKKNQSELIVSILNKKTSTEYLKDFLKPCLKGLDMGLISDAGCPGIADPGSSIVSEAYDLGIKVNPLVGPSSIFLALMASGMNGQEFKFNGYLPIEKVSRKEKIKKLEINSLSSTQIFMETPYRNNNLLNDLLKYLKPSTKLCIACDITLSSEFIKSDTITNWKKENYSFNKRPSIFLIQSE